MVNQTIIRHHPNGKYSIKHEQHRGIMQAPAKILFLDIENTPNLGWVWGKWQQNVLDFEKEWHILSYAYKWSTDEKVTVVALPDFPSAYERDSEDDKQLVKGLWKLLDEADIVVAHNGDGFDLPKINTRFLFYGLKPPTPYKSVDTLKIVKQAFMFNSNKMDDVGRYLGVGRKLTHTGFSLWKGCMNKEPESWKIMKDYNGQDVELLEKIYYLVRPWAKNHPNVNQGAMPHEACPKCGSDDVQRRGYSYTLLRKKQRFQCKNCATWYEGSAKKV